MSWANNNSNTKKYYNGGNVPYSAGAYTGLDLTNLIQGRDFKTQVEEQLLGEQTKEVKTDFQQRKQEELEAEAAEASKKSQKYGVLGSATGTLLSLIPGWGKFAKGHSISIKPMLINVSISIIIVNTALFGIGNMFFTNYYLGMVMILLAFLILKRLINRINNL